MLPHLEAVHAQGLISKHDEHLKKWVNIEWDATDLFSQQNGTIGFVYIDTPLQENICIIKLMVECYASL